MIDWGDTHTYLVIRAGKDIDGLAEGAQQMEMFARMDDVESVMALAWKARKQCDAIMDACGRDMLH